MSLQPLASASIANSVIRKVVISLAVGGGAYLLTALTRQPTIWALTMSIFVGGVSLVVQFLIDFDQRLVTVSRATELYAQVETSQLPTNEIVELVRSAATINLTRKPLLAKLVRARLRTMTKIFETITNSEAADFLTEEQDWLYTLVDQAQESIDATSVIGPVNSGFADEGFWDSQSAVDYLERQREATLRHVAIRRIFIAHRRDDLATDPKFQKLVADQREAGIDVRYLSRPPAEWRIDFVLFDGVISYEFSTGQNLSHQTSSSLQGTKLVVRDERVTRLKRQFERWWQEAAQLPPSTP